MSRLDAFTDVDRAFMQRALFIAERGRGRTSPNPIVGAVVVSPDGIVTGQGAHLRAGSPHAEVMALAEAGGGARGGTLYCTLEPCAHWGRTPPCAPQVADAGVSRAVIALTDPNPAVAGAGIELLQSRGVDVHVGLCGQEAARANAAFLTWITKRRPHVTLKIAQTKDGFVGRRLSPLRETSAGRLGLGTGGNSGEASESGTSARVKLTGAAMDRLMHRQRAHVDAIAIGADTLLADDPLLTPRGAFRTRPLVRVVFDWRLRCARERKLYGTLDAGPVLLFMTAAAAAANPAAVSGLERRGVRVITTADRNLSAALQTLGQMQVTSLLVEGGPSLQDAFAEAGLVDRVQTIIVPASLSDGVRVPQLLSLETALSDAIVTHAGQDILLEADVHRTD